MIINELLKKACCFNRQGKFPFVLKLYRKLSGLLTRLKSSCQDLICFAAVTIRFSGAYAYYQMGDRLRKKLLPIIDSDDYQKEVADQVYHQAFDFIERACQLRPNFVEAAMTMLSIAIMTGRNDAYIAAKHRIFSYQEKRAEMAGVAKHNFRILPAGPIFTTIGNTFVLDA